MVTVPPSAAPVVRVRLIGRVTATANDEEFDLGGPRARALVAALAFREGRRASADTVVREVWGDSTPGVRSALRAYISRLRSTPLGPYLDGGRTGYALAPGPHLDVDLWRLTGPSAPSLDEVASLVHAVPFDGAGDAPFLDAARAAVQALVRDAAVRAIDADPRHPLAQATAQRALAAHPNDLELRALLVTLRSGGAAPASPRPASPAAPTRRIGLPAPLASYLPRPDDEAHLAAALRLSRLVTVIGPAGVGKSRLAVEWARGRAGATQEHIWFCRAEEWQADLARSVGADGAQDGLIARMRPLRGTVVIDGLDSPSAPELAALTALLEQAPGVSALVTARRVLGVPGESARRLDVLDTAAARALFRLRAAVPAGDDEVDALTSALGRLPLAIELAAPRASEVPVSAVWHELAARTPPAGSPLDTALTATLSYLTETQRGTLERLCVFSGPFTRDSALSIDSASAESDLATLLRWALLIDESRLGVALMRVPDVVRRHLGVEPSASERSHHARWFAGRTLDAFDDLTTSRAAVVWPRLQAERADIDAAFGYAVREGARAEALSIAAGSSWAGLLSGTQASALAMARVAGEVAGVAPLDIEIRARLGRGILAYQLGSMEEAGAVLAEAAELADRVRAPDLVSLSRAFLAYLATLAPGGARLAIDRIREAEAHLGDASDSVRAMVTLISAQVARTRGDTAEALRLAQSAHRSAVDAGHGWVVLMSGVVAAKVLLDARDPRGAVRLIRDVLDDSRVRADPIAVLIAVSVAAGAAAGVGEDAAGARIIGAVDEIGARYGFDPRANEPADFDRYRRRVREGLTADGWRDAYAHGTGMTLADVIDEATALSR